MTGVSFGTAPNGKTATRGALAFALTQSGGMASAPKNALGSGGSVQVEVATCETGTATATSAGTLLSYDVYGAKAGRPSLTARPWAAAMQTDAPQGRTASARLVTRRAHR